MAKAGATGPHNHALGYRRDCDMCRAERRELRARTREKAKAREAADQARQQRQTPEYKRYRATQRRDERATRYASVVALPTPIAATGLGENEQAVIDQCALLSKASEHPSTVMQARTLARLLDSSELSALWSQTSRQLHTLLLSLSGPKRKLSGRLASIEMMTSRNRKPRAQAAQ